MSARIDRVVKHPPEGIYLFRFELKGQNGRPLCLATDVQGRGLYTVYKPKKNESPSDAWRTLCFAAKRMDMLEQKVVTAETVASPQDFALPPEATPQQAGAALLDKLTELGWAPQLAETITYLDNAPRVRNKKAPARS